MCLSDWNAKPCATWCQIHTLPCGRQEKNNAPDGAQNGEYPEYDPVSIWNKVPPLAREYGFPAAPDNPDFMEKISDKDASRCFPGGGRLGLDMPEIRYLYQAMPGFGHHDDAGVLHPGEEVLVTPQNSEKPYHATVADMDVILAQETPTDPIARKYRSCLH